MIEWWSTETSLRDHQLVIWQSSFAEQFVRFAGETGVRGAIGGSNERRIVLQGWKKQVEDRRKGAQVRGPIDEKNCFQENGLRSYVGE